MRRRKNSRPHSRYEPAIVDKSPYNGDVAAVYVSKPSVSYGECRIGSCRYGAYGKDLADTRARVQEHQRQHHPICGDAAPTPDWI